MTVWNHPSKPRWNLGHWGDDARLQWDPRLSSRAVADSILPSAGIRMTLGLDVWIPIFFSLSSSPFWRSYSLFLDDKENNVLTRLPWNLGQSQIWSSRAGQVLQWHCSGHVFPASLCTCCAVSIQCSSLSGQPDRFISLLNEYGHLYLCETCSGIPPPLSPLFCFLIHSLFQPCLLSLYYLPGEQNQYDPCPCKTHDLVQKTK